MFASLFARCDKTLFVISFIWTRYRTHDDMDKCRRYHFVYNTLWKIYRSGTPLDASILQMVKTCKNHRDRLWISRHLLTFASTQRLGKKISSDTLHVLQSMHKNENIDSRLRLRKVQHQFLKYRMRPHGRYYKQLLKKIMDDTGIITYLTATRVDTLSAE